MEKKSNIPSNISWVLVGVRAHSDLPIEEATINKMANEAFSEERLYKLFLCGVEVDKSGNLQEMEEGYLLLKGSLKEYKDGDYCIISAHDDGSLLFLPKEIEIEIEEEKEEKDAKNFIGNTDNL